MEKLEVKIQLSLEDLRRFNLYNFYNKPIGIFLTIIGIMMWGVVLYYLSGKNIMADRFPFQQFFFAVLMTILLPIFLFWNSKRTYNTNSRLKEEMNYTFDDTWIEIKGESFESKLTWAKIHKVKETKSWFLIFQNKFVANIVPKKEMTNNEILILRKIITSIPNLKSKLLNE